MAFVGRPKKFNSVDEMKPLIEAYFNQCDSAIAYRYTKTGEEYVIRKPKPYTVQGLATYLGICMDTLLEYQKDEQFSETIKEAKLKIEANKVEGMISGDWNATGVIFDLKNNHDWKDKTEADLNHSGGTNNKHTHEVIFKDFEK